MSKLSRSMAAVSLLMLVALGFGLHGCDSFPGNKQPPAAQIPGVSQNGDKEFTFCFWNVENLFDDRDDGRKGQGDKEYDPWLARNPQVLKEKLGKLADAILSVNGGRGPDLLGIVEVESVRAAELLQQTLNSRLDPTLHYTNVLMKEVAVGRHIAPALITRLPVVRDRTQQLGGKSKRILQSTVKVDGKELAVIVAHWTSRLQGGEDNRGEYADKIYGACNAMYHSDPNVDVLVCGDFNDSPSDVAVTQNLHATGDVNAVLAGGPLRLYHLQANKDPKAGFGTLHYQSKWSIFDHLVVSPGMLDQRGWSCDRDSVATVNSLSKQGDRQQRPWRFGGENEKGPRGYSDHFPVTVKLRVHAN